MKHLFLYEGVNGHGRHWESGRRRGSERRSVQELPHKFRGSTQVCHHSPCSFLFLSSLFITCNTIPSFLRMAHLASLDSVLPLQQIWNSGGLLESIWWTAKCRTGQDLRLQFTYMSSLLPVNWNRDKTFARWCNYSGKHIEAALETILNCSKHIQIAVLHIVAMGDHTQLSISIQVLILHSVSKCLLN